MQPAVSTDLTVEHDSSSEEITTPERSESPVRKKGKYDQTFKQNYTERWSFIKPSTRGTVYVFCNICKAHISIKSGGSYDIKMHIKTSKHISLAKSVASNKNIQSMFCSESSKSDLAVVRAEALFADFLIEHNLPISNSDHATSLLPCMFPDSKIAQKYSSRRTKTTEITHTLASYEKSDIIKDLKHMPFSLATDGSNDFKDTKLYPVVVRYFSKKAHKIVTVLLGLQESQQSSTGENIFKLLDSELKTNNLDWKNILSFGTDSAAAMTGKYRVWSFIQKENPNVFLAQCCCHLLHIGADRGCQALDAPVEDLVIDVYYYLHKSSKRQQELKTFQELYDENVGQVIKHVHTRWLSLTPCLQRILNMWNSLTVYFREQCHALQVKVFMNSYNKD